MWLQVRRAAFRQMLCLINALPWTKFLKSGSPKAFVGSQSMLAHGEETAFALKGLQHKQASYTPCEYRYICFTAGGTEAWACLFISSR